jgi:hypothetical protein
VSSVLLDLPAPGRSRQGGVDGSPAHRTAGGSPSACRTVLEDGLGVLATEQMTRLVQLIPQVHRTLCAERRPLGDAAAPVRGVDLSEDRAAPDLTRTS